MTGPAGDLPLLTLDAVPGRRTAAALGLVRGTTIRSKHVGADIVARLRMIVGGEMPEYTSLLAGARDQALDRMTAQARALGADAVVGVRFETSQVAQGASEVIAYGTAVRTASEASHGGA